MASPPGTRAFAYVIEEDGPFARVFRVPRDAKREPLAREPVRPSRTKKRAPSRPPPPAPVVTDRGVARAEIPLPTHAILFSVVQAGDDLRLRVETPLEAPRWVRYVASAHRVVEESAVASERVATRGACGGVPTITSTASPRPDAPTLVIARRGGELAPELRARAVAVVAEGGRVIEVHLPRERSDEADARAFAACIEAARARASGPVEVATSDATEADPR